MSSLSGEINQAGVQQPSEEKDHAPLLLFHRHSRRNSKAVVAAVAAGLMGNRPHAYASESEESSASGAPHPLSSFEPQNLLEAGLRDRTTSLQSLVRSRSVSVPQAAPSIIFKNPSTRASQPSLPPLYHAPLQFPPRRDLFSASIDHAHPNERKLGEVQLGVLDQAPQIMRGFSIRHGSKRGGGSVRERPQVLIELPREYYESLEAAPHASLIHLVSLYHLALVNHGFTSEAETIAGLLSGLQAGDEAVMEADLEGMDLLLKDGLLRLYLQAKPFLPQIPQQIVKFKSLTCTTDITVVDGYETVLTKALKILKLPLGVKQKIQEATLLNDVTGYLMPGTLTLILGPPGSGESILHTTLSGNTVPQSSVEGSITYNDESIQNVRIKRLAALVGQRDTHIPFLTVRETLKFARDCTVAFKASDYEDELQKIMGESIKMGQDPKVEITLSMMGLKRVANRFVGDQRIPTLTEEERHRVSAAEMFSGAYPVYFFDQLNTGSEESVIYDLLTAVRIFTRVRQVTVMASLTKPSPEVFDLFDRLIVMNRGHIVYQGPRQDSLSYFESIGYKKPRHVGVGEFLEEVTTKDGAVYLQSGFRKLELHDFVSAYKISDQYKDICRVVDNPGLLQELFVEGYHPLGLNFIERKEYEGDRGITPYIVSDEADEGGTLLEVSMDHTTTVDPGDELVACGGSNGSLHYMKIKGLPSSNGESLQTFIDKIPEPVRLQFERPFQRIKRVMTKQYFRDYVLGTKPEINTLVHREFVVTWRGKFGLYIRLFQAVFLGLFLGLLCFQIRKVPNQSDMNLYRTVFFVSVLNMFLFSMGQLPGLIEDRAVFYKQKGSYFFRPGSYALAKIVGSIPFSLCEATIWSVIVYFLTGLSSSDGGWHFFVFYIIMVLSVLNGASMTRFCSAYFANLEQAGFYIGLVITFLILFAGFLVPRLLVPSYWIWMYYLDPMQWAITALMINQFNSADYSTLCSSVTDLSLLPQCRTRLNDTVGFAFLEAGQFFTSNTVIAYAVAALLAWLVVWNVLTYYAWAKIRHEPPLKRRNFRSEGMGNLNIQKKEAEVEAGSKSLSQTALPITLSWHELSYDVLIPVVNRPRTILSYVSGWGEPGDMVALMGSGAEGRTTLLNCLAGRKVLRDRVNGQILVNGHPKKQKAFASYIGYVERIDAYTPYMTVQETVAFSAAMRLGKDSSSKQRKQFVEEVVELLDLKQIKDMLVLSLADDLTRERERRLAIATELASNPSVLFLDEPVKDLDSISASSIVACLKQVADTGRLVIATMSNPSQCILSSFNKVQLLKQSGEIAYFGSVGNDGQLIRSYFEAIPGTPLCPPNKSVSSFVGGLIGVGLAPRKSVKDYAFEYRVSELALRNYIHLQQLRRSKGQEINWKGPGATYTTIALEMIIKLQRQYWRNVDYSWGRLSFFILMSVILGSLFYHIDYTRGAGLNARASSIFISCMLVGITNAQNVIPLVVRMRAVYLREKASNQYSESFYNVAWTLAEIPYLAVANLFFCALFLPMVGMAMETSVQFFLYWFISLLFYLSVTYFGMFLAVASPKPVIASVLAPMIIGIWVSTGGLVIPQRRILNQFLWIFWTNPLQYALHGLTTISFYCQVYAPECMNNGLNPGCEWDSTLCPQCQCPRLEDASNRFVWLQIRNNRTLRRDRIPYDILFLLCSCILFRLLTYLSLKYMRHNKRT